MQAWTARRSAAALPVVGIVAVAVVLASHTLGSGRALGPVNPPSEVAAARLLRVTTTGDGRVVIPVVTTAAGAAEVNRQLAALHVPVTVTTLPATTGLIGTWFSGGPSEAAAPALAGEVRAIFGTSVPFTLPRSFPGSFDITAGRAPRPGESIVAGGRSNVLSPGRALACSGISGTPAEAAVRLLAARGYTVTGWHQTALPHVITHPPAGESVTYAVIDDLDPTDGTRVLPGREHDLVVSTGVPGTPTYEAARRLGFRNPLSRPRPADLVPSCPTHGGQACACRRGSR